jgi:hypothetical protein
MKQFLLHAKILLQMTPGCIFLYRYLYLPYRYILLIVGMSSHSTSVADPDPVLFDLWIRDPDHGSGMEKSGYGIQDPGYSPRIIFPRA